jgi:hypothetical protein
VSRSKRLVGVAEATPLAVARTRNNSQVGISVSLQSIDLQHSGMEPIKRRLLRVSLLFRFRCTPIVKFPSACSVGHGRKAFTVDDRIKLLLPPRQSRGTSLDGLEPFGLIRLAARGEQQTVARDDPASFVPISLQDGVKTKIKYTS